MITVVNKHHGHQPDWKQSFYIGRGSPLGNPYSHMPNTKAEHWVRTREEAVSHYAEWLKHKIQTNDKDVCKALNRILRATETGDVQLICFCKPKACHGDVIKAAIEEKLNGR